jgi:hypothetical protein
VRPSSLPFSYSSVHDIVQVNNGDCFLINDSITNLYKAVLGHASCRK